MTDEERVELLATLQAAEADLAAGNCHGVAPDVLAAELRAVRNAVLTAKAQRDETPIDALRKAKARRKWLC